MTALPVPVPAETIAALPFEQYIALEGVHATGLKDMHVSPLLYHWRQKQKRADSDTLRRGRASHTAILEPDRFMRDYVLWPKSNGRRYGKKWDAFKEMAGERTIITEDIYDASLRMRDAVRSHRDAAAILSERGQPELTVKWTHPRTGAKCVSRFDWLCSVLADLKSTRNPAPGKFASDAARFGYMLQLGFYGDAAAVSGFGALPTVIIAAQNVAPFDVGVYDIPERELQPGRDQYEKALDKLIECTRAGIWPGVAPERTELHMPAWATGEDEALTFSGAPLFGDAPEDE
jgi:hypothetical protein